MSFLSGPSVETIRSRRWVVFVTSIIWNGLFAAPLFGWASLRQMLMDFGWKSDACIANCASYDAIWEAEYTSTLNGSALAKYESMSGSEKAAQWNPTVQAAAVPVEAVQVEVTTSSVGGFDDFMGSSTVQATPTENSTGLDSFADLTGSPAPADNQMTTVNLSSDNNDLGASLF